MNAIDFAPGTLGAALAAEREGLGAVRFVGGVPVWVPGERPRFEIELEDEEAAK